MRQQGVSYAADSDEALDAVEFWTRTLAVDFNDALADPREIEAAGRQIPREAWEEWGLVTTTVSDVVETLERHAAAGFDEVQLLSTSPDQARFVDAMADVLQ